MFRTEFAEEEKLWKGRSSAIPFHADSSLGHIVLDAMKSNGSRCAQISHENGIRISYDEMYTKTIRAAQNIRKLGYKPREVFGIVAGNDYHLAPIVYAALCLGCTINALDMSLGKFEMVHLLKMTKPRLMFCDVAAYNLVSESLQILGNFAKIYTFGGQTKNSEPVENLFKETGKEQYFLPNVLDGKHDIAVLLSTPGSTSSAKCVCLSHAALIERQYQLTTVLNSNDVLFTYSALNQISGWQVFIAATLLGATRVVTRKKSSPESQLGLVDKYEITFIANGTQEMVLLAKNKSLEKANLASLRYCLTGGATIPLTLAAKLDSYLENGSVILSYSMTEAAGFITFDSKFSRSVGQLVNNVTVKIIDKYGQRCGVGDDGEICVKLVNHFLGYYRNPRATEEFVDSEGFIRTRDIGRFDENGSLHVVERKKDLLKYDNQQIAPSEIEAFLMEMPNVNSACIVGLTDPNYRGDLLAAVITRNDNLQTTEVEIVEIVADHFPEYKHLRGGVYFVDSLPTTAMTPCGRIERASVKELVIDMRSKAMRSKNAGVRKVHGSKCVKFTDDKKYFFSSS